MTSKKKTTKHKKGFSEVLPKTSNKNVNKNNINITIHSPKKKRTYKKRTPTSQRQQQPITIINQIPNNQTPNNQQLPQQLDLNKTAFNYNMPRHKPLNTNDLEPRPPKSKIPAKISTPKDDIKLPSKPLMRNDISYKISSPLEPLEESKPKIRFDGYITPPEFKSQVPTTSEDESRYSPDASGFLHLTTLKPRPQQNLSHYLSNRFFETPLFENQTATTYNDEEDDLPDLEPISNPAETLIKQKAFNSLKKNRINNIVDRNKERIENEYMGDEDKNYFKQILRPVEDSFQSQVPTSGFTRTPSRRDTILPTYRNTEATSFTETPNIYQAEKPKRKRRTKAEMEWYRLMKGDEDRETTDIKKQYKEMRDMLSEDFKSNDMRHIEKYKELDKRREILRNQSQKRTIKIKKDTNPIELLHTLRQMNADADERERLRK